MLENVSILVYSETEYDYTTLADEYLCGVDYVVELGQLEELLKGFHTDTFFAVFSLSTLTGSLAADIIAAAHVPSTITPIEWKPLTLIPWKWLGKLLFRRAFARADFYVFFGK